MGQGTNSSNTHLPEEQRESTLSLRMSIPHSRRSCAGGHLTPCFDKLKGHAGQRAPAKHTYCLIGIVGLRVIAPKTSLGKPCRFVSLHAPKKPVVYKYITGCRRHADDLRSSHPTSRAFALYALKCFQCPPLSQLWQSSSRDAAANPLNSRVSPQTRPY